MGKNNSTKVIAIGIVSISVGIILIQSTGSLNKEQGISISMEKIEMEDVSYL